MAKPVLSVRVDAGLDKALRRRAAHEQITVGDLCLRFLVEGLERPPPADDVAEVVVTSGGVERTARA